MPKKKKVDNKGLVKMVQDGVPQKEVMEAFGFKTSNQFKIAYLNALMETGQAPVISRARGGAKASGPSREVAVNKRGSLIVPKELVEELGLRQGDSFEVRKSKAGLSLKAK